MNLNEQILHTSIDANVATFKNYIQNPHKDLRVCVTIPAKNEQDYLLNTLMALVNQKANTGELLNKNFFEILVLCHNCTDSTYESALKFKKDYPELNLHVLELNSMIIDNIGAARRVLMHLSAQRLNANDAWIAMTDADTLPENDWIYTILSQPKNIDMVCGRINVNTANLGSEVIKMLQAKIDYNALKAHIESLIIPSICDPFPKHNNNSGPNMALKRHVYLSVNGIPPIPFLEDISLYNRVKSFGYNVRHINDLVVETSGRLFSKTECGLGAELNLWSTNEVFYRVEDLETLISRFRIHKKIKELFYEYDVYLLDEIAELSLLDLSKVEDIYIKSSIYEEMIIKIEEELETNINWKKTFPIKDILIATLELKSYTQSVKHLSFARV